MDLTLGSLHNLLQLVALSLSFSRSRSLSLTLQYTVHFGYQENECRSTLRHVETLTPVCCKSGKTRDAHARTADILLARGQDGALLGAATLSRLPRHACSSGSSEGRWRAGVHPPPPHRTPPHSTRPPPHTIPPPPPPQHKLGQSPPPPPTPPQTTLPPALGLQGFRVSLKALGFQGFRISGLRVLGL